nr:hypothetical protein [Escherichia coli]
MEFELNGAITDNWQLTFGATRYIAEDNEGNAVNPNLPRTTVKMFTSYRLPVMPELTVGVVLTGKIACIPTRDTVWHLPRRAR